MWRDRHGVERLPERSPTAEYVIERPPRTSRYRQGRRKEEGHEKYYDANSPRPGADPQTSLRRICIVHTFVPLLTRIYNFLLLFSRGGRLKNASHLSTEGSIVEHTGENMGHMPHRSLVCRSRLQTTSLERCRDANCGRALFYCLRKVFLGDLACGDLDCVT